MHEVGDADGAGIDVPGFLVEHDAEVLVLGERGTLLEVLGGARRVDIAKGDDVLRLSGLI